MKNLRIAASALSAAFVLCLSLAGSGYAADPASHVVGTTEIQAQIQGQLDSQAADRLAIQSLLARPEVQRIAGAAGLDLERANAAVGTLSGAELQRLAEQARQADSQIVGGTMTMSWTMVILIVIALVVIIAVI